jgi:shikimate kinase
LNQKLIFIAGPAGSGKSTLANAVAKELEVTVLDLDEDQAVFLNRHEAEISDSGPETVLAKYRDSRYKELLSRVRAEVNRGKSVIVTAPFTNEISNAENWKTVIAEFSALKVVPELVWIRVNAPLLRSRLLLRSEGRDREKISSTQSLQRYLDNALQVRPVVEYVEIDGELPLAEQVKVTIR